MRIKRRSVLWQLFLGFLSVMLAANVGLYFYMVSIMKSYVYGMESRDLQRESLAIANNLEDGGSVLQDESLLRDLSVTLDYRIRLLDRRGTVLLDTNPGIGNDLPATSLRQALEGAANLAVTRDSHNEAFLTEVRPVRLAGGEQGVLAVNTPVSGVTSAVRDVEKQLFLGTILVVIASVVVSFYFTRKLTMPIKELIAGTEQVGKGIYEKIEVKDTNNELNDLAVAFNEMVGRLSQIDEEHRQIDTLQKEFLSDLSHELRTPLTTLEAFLEALKDGVVGDERKKQQYIVALYEETMHLKRLTSDLLQLARIESGHVVVEKVSFDPAEAIRNVAQNRAEAAARRGNRLETALGEEYPALFCDPDHFRQILTNLINNAIQFTSDGVIRVEALVEGGFLKVSVQDTGIGIAPDQIPFIWDRFFKVDKARSKHEQESGLGLSIVKKLVELHDGRVEVESTPGAGSQFSFLLPLRGPAPLSQGTHSAGGVWRNAL